MSKYADQDFPDRSVKPFRLVRLCHYPVHGDQMIATPEDALKNHVDILGCQFFQARDDVLAELEALSSDADYRAKLGNTNAAKFEAIASLPDEQQQVALALAEEALNCLINRVVQTLGGEERNYPGGYVINYKIEAQVSKITGASSNGVKLKKVARQLITGDKKDTLLTSFGRLLNSFGRRRNAEAQR